MPRHASDHRPARPTWRCGTCGIAWPCSPAKLRLLAEYRLDRPALLIHLARLQTEAADNLAALNPNAPPVDLTERFTGWASAR
ncbi:flavin reductase [Micromonospora acroterricola]|uniref:Flavin reductase n=1 Tax=Micromonospora acroterricola TaxID=2202421 RepID=A0A317D0N4_9ACTN|nr:flavin reductase [Micromonospora acroterricola]PWR07376.1 flavin reductase [Micromonospora acroterricola]